VAGGGGRRCAPSVVEDRRATPELHPGARVGVGRGVAVAATTSAGEFHARTFASPGEKTRHLKLQKKLARQKKGSANRAETLKAMGRICTSAVGRRADI